MIDPLLPSGTPRDTFPYPLVGVPLDEWNPSFLLRSIGSIRRIKVPFREGFEWTLDGRGGVWVGDTGRGRITLLSLEGDTLKVVRIGNPGAPVSAEERRAAIEALGPGGSGLDHSMIPGRKPVFRMIIPTEDGGLWLVREGEGPLWFVDMIDGDGRIVGSAELPVEPDLEALPVVEGVH